MNRKKDIYIKLEKIKHIVELVENIREKKEHLASLFQRVEQLSQEEQQVIEKWGSTLEDISIKIDHISS